MMLLALMFILLCSHTNQHDCTDDTSCLVSDKRETDTLLLLQKEMDTNDTQETTTTEVFTTEETTTAMITTTTLKTTSQPTPTLSPALKPSQPSAVCWCDQTGNVCDMNCCCDTECSISQKQVFTHCKDQAPIYDEKHCYSSNFFFKKPSDVRSIQNQGLFCIVRDNLSTMKEFQSRDPIKSVEDFEQAMRKSDRISQSRRNSWVSKFSYQAYRAGSIVWSVSKGNLAPFHIASKTFGDLCLTRLPITYLNNVDTECVWRIPRTEPMCSQAVGDFLSKLKNPIVVSPLMINLTDIKSSIANCSSSDTCTHLRTFLCKQSNCTKLDSLKPLNCAHLGLEIAINFYHNGTEGIQSASAFIHLLNTTKLKTSVKFLWTDAENDGFVRSGNPGYIKGRPILSGRKISSISNDTSGKREAIEMTVSPKGWLTTFSSTNGKCSSERESILFGDNLRRLCNLDLKRKYFSKNGCTELQRLILDFLIQSDKANSSNLNKYLGVYGNARVEVISDWLQMIIDYFPLMSTQPTFGNSTYGLSCRGIFSHVYLDIAIAKFGSFYNPQFKLIGALVRFAPPQDFLVRCRNIGCEEIAKNHTIKLMTEVNFIDVSKPAERKFAQPPGLEAKLPHDFFYPFFAFNRAVSLAFSRVLLITSLFIVI